MHQGDDGSFLVIEQPLPAALTSDQRQPTAEATYAKPSS
jgi:hypothetical protein